MMIRHFHKFLAQCALAAVFMAMGGYSLAGDAPDLLKGQVLYLPVYSHIYHGDLDRNGNPAQTLVSTHVSIRNTDLRVPVKVLYARYFDTDGKLVKEYLPTPKILPPLGTVELFVPRSDASGGSGANFVIEWLAETPANVLLVEALHADITPARTLMFTTVARPIKAR